MQWTFICLEGETVRYKDEQNNEKEIPLDVVICDGFLKNFNRDDGVAIINHLSSRDGDFQITRHGTTMLVTEWRKNALIWFMGLFMVVIFYSLLCHGRYIEIFSFKCTSSFLFFPLAFIITDAINELYGYHIARRIIFSAASTLLIGALLFSLTFLFQGTYKSGDEQPFFNVLGQLPIIASLHTIGILIADITNAKLFDLIKKSNLVQGLWFRALLSTAIAHLCFSLVITPMALCVGLWDFTSVEQVIHIISSDYWLKMAYTLIGMPLLYGVTLWVKQKETTFYTRKFWSPHCLLC